MVARVKTVAFQGIDVLEVETQVTIASGLPSFTVVGLPDKAVGESRERVRAALASMGLALPPKRITVNLAPADLLKEGSHFDLPIALALLAAMEVLSPDACPTAPITRSGRWPPIRPRSCSSSAFSVFTSSAMIAADAPVIAWRSTGPNWWNP